MFYLDVLDYSAELREREAILLRTMDLVKQLGVEFAYPTRTLQVEATPPMTRVVKAVFSR
jgi:MscS family membrane protein